jgi:hypothetical protein
METDESFRVESLTVKVHRGGYLVEGTIFAFEGFDNQGIHRLQQAMEEDVGVPVEVRLTVIPATLSVAGER